MRLLTVARRHWILMGVAVLLGALLAFLWVFQVSWNNGVQIKRKAPGTYVTSVNAVIDTAEFGIGRSDTDMYRLSLLAPTYAQLITSEPVMEKVKESLRGSKDVVITAAPVESSPMIKLSVEGPSPEGLDNTAVAIVDAFGDYLSESQAVSEVPVDLRIVIRGVGRPSAPTLLSNRQIEIGIIAFFIPVIAALVLAFRMEYTGDESRSEMVDEG